MSTFDLTCDRTDGDVMNVDTGPGLVHLHTSNTYCGEHQSASVTLDRDKVEQLRDALSVWLANPHNGGPTDTLQCWWGLSYASWLTVPRVLMQAMPAEWQERAGVLLAEYSAAFPKTPNLTIGVTARGSDGKLVPMPEWLNNYRHPNRAEIDKCRGEP